MPNPRGFHFQLAFDLFGEHFHMIGKRAVILAKPCRFCQRLLTRA
jgi:hypothetical protein